MSILQIRSIAACVAFTFCTALMGETFVANGISYKITNPSTPYTVEVERFDFETGSKHTGDIKLPHYVKHNNIRYRITGIGDFAFAHCDKLNSVRIPNGVVYVGMDAFSDCTELASIRIPNSVTDIGQGAFSYCQNIKSITIPNGVKEIGSFAFQECRNLQHIKIAKNVEYIGMSIHQACSSLTSIKIDPRNKSYDSRNKCNAIIETNKNMLITGCKTTKIPNSVEVLNCGSYSRLTDIYVITIPYGVKTIRHGTFEGCRDLVSVEIPNSIVEIEDNAFEGCNKLSIIKCLATTPPRIKSNLLPSNSSKITIYVPCSSMQAYQNNQHWKQYDLQCIEQ